METAGAMVERSKFVPIAHDTAAPSFTPTLEIQAGMATLSSVKYEFAF